MANGEMVLYKCDPIMKDMTLHTCRHHDNPCCCFGMVSYKHDLLTFGEFYPFENITAPTHLDSYWCICVCGMVF